MRRQKIVVSFFLVLLSLISGCAKKSSTQASHCSDIGMKRGVALSPQGFPNTYDEIASFFTEVGEWPDSTMFWNGAWVEDTDSGTDAGEIPSTPVTVMSQADTYGFTPVISFGWRAGTTLYLKVPGNSTNNWTNTEAKTLFKSMLKDFASLYQPAYLFIGNENDFYYEQDSSDFQNWLDFLAEAYDEIKAESPDTQVGTIYNFEHLSGTGALNGWSTSYWPALENVNFDKIDLFGVTVYPFFNYENATDVPSDYLEPFFSRAQGKPVAITETGWQSDEAPIGAAYSWAYGEEEQTNLIDALYQMISGQDVPFMQWLFLYPYEDDGSDSDGYRIFNSLSLKTSDGTKKSAYTPWYNCNE